MQQALSDADAAVRLTVNAMRLATQVCALGAPAAADRALLIAENALATTMQQLGRVQALVAQRLLLKQQQGQQQAAAGFLGDDVYVQYAEGVVYDEELLDTCSSALSTACLH